MLKINYLGLRLTVEGMLPLMEPGGAIVAVGSTAALGWEQRINELSSLLMATSTEAVEQWCADQNPAMAYYTSKQAVILYTKRIAGFAGPVETNILADFEATMGREVLEAARQSVGRHATVDDVVPVIEFLGSEHAGWINGQDIQVDGGLFASLIAGLDHAAVHRVVSAHAGLTEVSLHGDTVRPRVCEGPWWQRVAQPGQF